MASLYIKDTEANALATELADRRGLSKTAAVKLALRHELQRDADHSDQSRSVSEVLEQLWRDFPLGEPTGLEADKSFYDSLNDEEDD
jgi:antitoxin VapB